MSRKRLSSCWLTLLWLAGLLILGGVVWWRYTQEGSQLQRLAAQKPPQRQAFKLGLTSEAGGLPYWALSYDPSLRVELLEREDQEELLTLLEVGALDGALIELNQAALAIPRQRGFRIAFPSHRSQFSWRLVGLAATPPRQAQTLAYLRGSSAQYASLEAEVGYLASQGNTQIRRLPLATYPEIERALQSGQIDLALWPAERPLPSGLKAWTSLEGKPQLYLLVTPARPYPHNLGSQLLPQVAQVWFTYANRLNKPQERERLLGALGRGEKRERVPRLRQLLKASKVSYLERDQALNWFQDPHSKAAIQEFISEWSLAGVYQAPYAASPKYQIAPYLLSSWQAALKAKEPSKAGSAAPASKGRSQAPATPQPPQKEAEAAESKAKEEEPPAKGPVRQGRRSGVELVLPEDEISPAPPKAASPAPTPSASPAASKNAKDAQAPVSDAELFQEEIEGGRMVPPPPPPPAVPTLAPNSPYRF